MNTVENSLTNITDFLKAISDKNRLSILKYLAGGEKCVCEIWEDIDLPQNLVSHHLKVLKKLDLITSKKRGLKVIYRLNKIRIKKYLKTLYIFLI